MTDCERCRMADDDFAAATQTIRERTAERDQLADDLREGGRSRLLERATAAESELAALRAESIPTLRK